MERLKKQMHNHHGTLPITAPGPGWESTSLSPLKLRVAWFWRVPDEQKWLVSLLGRSFKS